MRHVVQHHLSSDFLLLFLGFSFPFQLTNDSYTLLDIGVLTYSTPITSGPSHSRLPP